jgi:flagellar biosynthesis/type III secretory pathway protein FliH
MLYREEKILELKKTKDIIKGMDEMTPAEQEQYAILMSAFLPAYNAGCRDGYKTGYAEGSASKKKRKKKQ